MFQLVLTESLRSHLSDVSAIAAWNSSRCFAMQNAQNGSYDGTHSLLRQTM